MRIGNKVMCVQVSIPATMYAKESPPRGFPSVNDREASKMLGSMSSRPVTGGGRGGGER